LVKTNEEPETVDLTIEEEEIPTKKAEAVTLTVDEDILTYPASLNATPYLEQVITDCQFHVKWQKGRLRLPKILQFLNQ
jgi:hypothetical protein